MNSIIIGSYTFTDADLISGSISMGHSVIGETLSADSLVFIVNSKHTGNHKLLTNSLQWYTTSANQGFVIADSNVQSIPYATSASYYIDGTLVGQFFVSKIERVARDKFKFTCTSAVGLLITSNHLGGIYTSVTASTVIADILSGISYTLDASLANASVRGYLPVATKRDNLQQVLFAIGGAVKINASGGFQIVPMSPTVTSEIEPSRIYIGGSIEQGKTYNAVELTEHNYFESGDSEVLYDDSIEGQQLITYTEPHHHYTITGGRIISSGANYCVVAPPSGSQYSAVTVSGQKYTHVQRVIRAGNSNSANENIMYVRNAYLANPEIADSLAERVWNYAQCNTYIKQNIVVGSERAGDLVKIMNPYTYESVKAVVTNMDIAISKTNKATTKFLLGYTPEGVISGFNYYKLITSNAAWYKSGNYVYVGGTALKDNNGNPVTVDKIRIICVGGGDGGSGGNNGENGGDGAWTKTGLDPSGSNNLEVGAGGNGGNGGNAGNGGRIFEISLNLVSGNSGNISIGSGGSGGAVGTSGTSGGNTTFTLGNKTYSSSAGKLYPYGYLEQKTLMSFANKGVQGVAGGNGGGANGTTGENGQDVGSYTGGAGVGMQGRASSFFPTADICSETTGPAGGGGASNNGNGSNASYGKGGAGANGSSGANASNYGAGGSGGNGGAGGGGSSGGYYHGIWLREGSSKYFYNTTGASGGTGGSGGNGKAGCLMIYY